MSARQDAEVRALIQVLDALEPLDIVAQERVLRFVNERVLTGPLGADGPDGPSLPQDGAE